MKSANLYRVYIVIGNGPVFVALLWKIGTYAVMREVGTYCKSSDCEDTGQHVTITNSLGVRHSHTLPCVARWQRALPRRGGGLGAPCAD
jgi:hypothetical protein